MGKQFVHIFAVVLLFSSNWVNAATIKAQKWETIDITFSIKKDIPYPFELELSCTFSSENSDTLIVPGFYNGDRQWIVRFTPKTTGLWKCISQSSNKKMDGIVKTIEVGDNNPNNPGSVQINVDNPRLFSYENGDPYHLLAFEADWLFAPDYGDPELPKTRQLVSTIAENGFNQVVMNVYAHDASWKKDPDLLPEYNYANRLDIFPFKGDNENPDYSGLNIDYYKHFMDFLTRIEFHKLTPSNKHSTTGICLINKEKDTYVYYIPTENTSVIAQNLEEAESLEITWFNPITGEYSEPAKRKRNKYVRINKKYPGQDDIAIVKLIK